MKKAFIALLTAVFAFPIFPPVSVRAADFNMNFIVSDAEFTDATSMSAGKIQEFLNLQPGVLKDYRTTVNGVDKSAAQIISDAAVAKSISPKVILTTIQKESSMLTKNCFAISATESNPLCPGSNSLQYYLDWVVFYGWCDSCSTGSNRGFYNQINAAASAFRRYLDAIALQGYTVSGWGPGRTKSMTCISSDASRGLCTNGTTISITPINSATSALYTYTPHPGGNFSFWKLWNGYSFSSARLYPTGSLLKAKGSNVVYLIQGNQKRPFASNAAFLSRYSYNSVITVAPDQLFFYDQGKSIKFANYSLLRSPKRVTYLLVDDTVRPITSKGFTAAGFQKEEVVKVTQEDIASYDLGTTITSQNIYPSGQLLQNKSNGGIVFVMDGIKHGIPSKQVYTSQFGKRKAIPVKASVLDSYQSGPSVGFKDGELVALRGANGKATGSVYFISGGQRRPIANWAAAKAYKFDLIWKNLILTNQASLNIHPIGQILTSEPEPLVQVASQ